MTPQPGRRAPRYRVVVYELDNDHQTKVMDATATGYIAAATIRHGEMDIALANAGPRNLQEHIALFIAGQYRVL